VLEELIRVNMLCGYFGLCIQGHNIYMHYERGRLREIRTCRLCSSLVFHETSQHELHAHTYHPFHNINVNQIILFKVIHFMDIEENLAF
jgi:hypothetical protein